MRKIILFSLLLSASFISAQTYSTDGIEIKDISKEEKEALSTKGKDVESMKVVCSKDNLTVRPGEHFMVGVIAKLKNGKEIRTPLAGGENNLNFNYNIKAIGTVKMDSEKKFIYVHNLAKLIDDQFLITIQDRFHEELKEDLVFTMNYQNNHVLFDLKGENGSNGSQPREKESCREFRGDDGTDGEDGTDAPDLDIYIQKTKHAITGVPVFRVFIVASNGQTRSYIFEEGYSLNLKSVGGKGGNGGAGGKGSAITSACSYNHNRGVQGDGGRGGNGGNGGNINITKNEEFNYSEVISLVTRGGQSGEGGYGTTKGTKGTYGKDGKITTRVDPSLVVTFTLD